MKLGEATTEDIWLLRMYNRYYLSSFFISSSGIYLEINSSMTLKKGHLPSYNMAYYTQSLHKSM